ncbi:ABC transporter ATP-binding protein/permease [Klebsiella indica]|uniref:ABC transporter ATP-binding protein/permease n=1 Tax=Klebsiella indica TaxID=2582917 RepID=A0A5R9L8F1_9ENTR|nr:ATP-binding cassette domain-containing protein [Klebsiella indica]TLV04997.1 ABC transporter ATP-binding protein/permease [Klebsiella indica]
MASSSSYRDSLSPHDKDNYRLNKRFFQRLWRLIKPYWFRRSAWKPWLILGILLLSAGGFSIAGGYFSHLVAETTNALVNKSSFYWRLTIWMSFIGLLQSATMWYTIYIGGKLLLDWRQWLSQHLIDSYLRNRTYYEIQKDDTIDNPDERIQEEVSPFCQTVIGFPQYVVSSVVSIGVQASIIREISIPLFWSILAYAVVNTLVTLWVYSPTVRQNWDQTIANARWRTSLMHLRDNAETIAFYRGERSERQRLLKDLTTLAKTKMRIILYGLVLSLTDQISGVILKLLPLLFVVPLYFEGHVQFGTIDQAAAAAGMIVAGLSILSNYLPALTQSMPTVVRLAEIQEKFEALSDQHQPQRHTINKVLNDNVCLKSVDVYTPGGEQHLVHQLSLNVTPGEHLVIVGRTGVGKSSLLRVLAGLWQRGEGELAMPSLDQTMFIPQRPYMVMTDLRSQLLYPNQDIALDDATLRQVFITLGRPDFLDKQGGLDAIKDWRKVLSLGEQQLIAFARVLLRQPRFVFLDEATSALDLATEYHVYQCLARSKITFISVGHRKSILAFHKQKLELLPQGNWHLSQLPVPVASEQDLLEKVG